MTIDCCQEVEGWCRNTCSDPVAQNVIHRALRTLIATALTACLPCGSGTLQFLQLQQIPASSDSHILEHPFHTHTRSQVAGGEVGATHTDEQQAFTSDPASTSQTAWAHRFLRDKSPSSAASLRDLLQLHPSGARQIRTPPTEQQQSKGRCKPDDMMHSSSSPGSAVSCRSESALIPFAVVAMGQPLCELLCMGSNVQSDASWAAVLSAASGTSLTPCSRLSSVLRTSACPEIRCGR